MVYKENSKNKTWLNIVFQNVKHCTDKYIAKIKNESIKDESSNILIQFIQYYTFSSSLGMRMHVYTFSLRSVNLASLCSRK